MPATFASWQLTLTPAGAFASPDALTATDWLAAPVPGTVAQALSNAGRWRLDDPAPLHDRDAWYRTTITGQGRHTLRLDGLATVAEVWLDNVLVLTSTSMFERHDVPLDLAGEHALHVAFRSLDAHLAGLSGPRPRWKPRMIPDQRLRLARTTLLGHMPGWCPPVHAVGPWRPIALIDHAPLHVASRHVRAGLRGRDGRLGVRLTLGGDAAATSGPATLRCGGAAIAMTRDGAALSAELTIPDVERWWPHTAGEPVLHDVGVEVGGTTFALGRTGFRTLAVDRGSDGQGFALIVNGERIFCGGACWTTPDLVGLPGSREAYAPSLALAKAANLTMIRVGGTMAYESPAFFEVCDELGLLVWQEAMLANFDYPAADPGFMAAMRREIETLLEGIGASPSLAVFCGGSEVFQQAAMMGLPAGRWSSPLYDEVLPGLLAEHRPDAIYVPSSPSGGALPFVAAGGPTHYYGVGAYCRPLEDARRAGVRFASECLAFANVPDEASPAMSRVPAAHHPDWKRRVPRDAGASWDFEDVREHYMQVLGEGGGALDVRRLRYEDPERYGDLSRAVTAETVERTVDEWRRPGSVTAGALVWFWQDLWAGAGWGIVDAAGRPKSPWHGLRRALAPLRLMISDEGVNGLVVHLVNDGPAEASGTLVLEALRDGALPLVAGRRVVTVPARGALSLSAFELFGAFFDAGYAYRFGPCAHDMVTARLEGDGGCLAEAFHLLAPARSGQHRAELAVALEQDEAGWFLRLSSPRAALFTQVVDPQFEAQENWFHLAPKRERTVRLRPAGPREARPAGTVKALNLAGAARYEAS